MSAADFADALKKNPNVPAAVKKAIGSKKGSLTSGGVKPEKDKQVLYDEGFNKAFTAGKSEITTAKSRIKVTQDKSGKTAWDQVVTPDMAKGEAPGDWRRTSAEGKEFSPATFHSDKHEVIYGWTPGAFSTNKREQQLILVMIVTEIEVTNPAGDTKVFKTSPNEIAETMMHEIALHAGFQSARKNDADDDSPSRNMYVNEIEDFFRGPRDSSGNVPDNQTTTDIKAFLAQPKPGSTPQPGKAGGSASGSGSTPTPK